MINVNSSILPKQKFVQLTFSDNGIGFRKEYKEQIFQLFQRLHTKQEYSGTGIGLSIVKKITEHYKGFIVADSTPDEGATFDVWLPLE
jgi:light-regulated signal transduction histidine kinase (bacteriophytochrome)